MRLTCRSSHRDDAVPPPGREEEAAGLLRACLLNLASCALKLEDWALTTETCTRVIDNEDGCTQALRAKALYRRGQARMESAEFEGAKQDLREAGQLDPTSREVRAQYAVCKEREAAAKKGEADAQKAVFAKMF